MAPSSPDLNPVENLWDILKCDIYSEGRQYTTLNIIWEAVVAAADSIDGRLMTVTEKSDGYIGHWMIFVFVFWNATIIYL